MKKEMNTNINQVAARNAATVKRLIDAGRGMTAEAFIKHALAVRPDRTEQVCDHLWLQAVKPVKRLTGRRGGVTRQQVWERACEAMDAGDIRKFERIISRRPDVVQWLRERITAPKVEARPHVKPLPETKPEAVAVDPAKLERDRWLAEKRRRDRIKAAAAAALKKGQPKEFLRIHAENPSAWQPMPPLQAVAVSKPADGDHKRAVVAAAKRVAKRAAKAAVARQAFDAASTAAILAAEEAAAKAEAERLEAIQSQPSIWAGR